MRTRILVAAGAAAAALAGGLLWAQASGVPGAGPHGPFGRFGPFDFLAAHHALHELGLTDEQKTQIKGILRSHRQEFHGSVERLRSAHEAVRQLSGQDAIDEDAIRERVREAAGPLGDLAVLHARVRREIGAVLTPEQREKAESLLEQFWSHREGVRRSLHELGHDLLEDPS